jgi:hypothetical protein
MAEYSSCLKGSFKEPGRLYLLKIAMGSAGYRLVAIKEPELSALEEMKERYDVCFSDCVSLLLSKADRADLDAAFLERIQGRLQEARRN